MPNDLAPVTPSQLLNIAVDKSADVEQMTKLFELQVAWEKNEAVKEYTASMVDVQASMPIVGKGLQNKQTNSTYAALDAIISAAKPIYTKGGFSISFYEGETPKDNHTRICADVIHRAGHKETYHYDAPMDGVGIKGNAMMTATHAKASSTTYARRYLMCMIWNIPTGDDDGNPPPSETINENQIAEITALAQEVGKNVKDPALLKYFHVETIDQLPAKYFQDAISALEKFR